MHHLDLTTKNHHNDPQYALIDQAWQAGLIFLVLRSSCLAIQVF